MEDRLLVYFQGKNPWVEILGRHTVWNDYILSNHQSYQTMFWSASYRTYTGLTQS